MRKFEAFYQRLQQALYLGSDFEKAELKEIQSLSSGEDDKTKDNPSAAKYRLDATGNPNSISHLKLKLAKWPIKTNSRAESDYCSPTLKSDQPGKLKSIAV